MSSLGQGVFVADAACPTDVATVVVGRFLAMCSAGSRANNVASTMTSPCRLVSLRAAEPMLPPLPPTADAAVAAAAAAAAAAAIGGFAGMDAAAFVAAPLPTCAIVSHQIKLRSGN